MNYHVADHPAGEPVPVTTFACLLSHRHRRLGQRSQSQANGLALQSCHHQQDYIPEPTAVTCRLIICCNTTTKLFIFFGYYYICFVYSNLPEAAVKSTVRLLLVYNLPFSRHISFCLPDKFSLFISKHFEWVA